MPSDSRAFDRPASCLESGAKAVAVELNLVNAPAEQLVADLQAWCRKAEDSGIAALQDFSMQLRAARA